MFSFIEIIEIIFIPIIENDSLDSIKYYYKPLDEYLDKHAPSLGEKKCLLYKQDVITDIIRFDNIETLDFLIGTRELKNENYKFQSSNFETTDAKEFIARYDYYYDYLYDYYQIKLIFVKLN